MEHRIKKSFRNLRLTEVIPQGWIKEQLERDTEGFVGRLDEYCREASSDIFGANKVTVTRDGFWGTWWNGEIEGNWIDGLVRTAFLSESEESRQKAGTYMEHLLQHAGEEDGYIGIYQPEARFQCSESNGELWCQSRILLAMLGYYEATGDTKLRDAAIACARLIVSHYGPKASGRSYYSVPEKDGSKSHGLTVIEPLLMLYDITNEKDFLDFCVFLYEDFSNTPISHMFDDLQLGNVLDAERPFYSHGVHTCEHLRIPLLLFYYTGDDRYRIAYRNAYKKIERYLGISGACKSDETLGSFNVEFDKVTPESAANLSPGFPLPEAGYEYCTLTELLLSLHTALMYTGESQYADMAERLLFNAAMGARLSSGKGIGYLSADNLYEATKARGRRWDYSATHDDTAVCCVPNAGRILPYHISRMWMKTGDGGIAAIFYGPCKLTTDINGTPLEIMEQTCYPFEGDIQFRISLPDDTHFRLMLRIPAWCEVPRIVINGADEAISIAPGFVVIDRTWKNDDEILLFLPSGIRREKAIDGSAAVVRGALVYALDIEGEFTITHKYGINGFYDQDCVPAEGQTWDYILKTEDRESQSKYFRLISNKKADIFPWDESPVAIEADVLNSISQPKTIKLVPLGTTNLRRTCFPHVTM